MSGFLDTSVVVRYLRGDVPQRAEQAARIIDGDDDLFITDVVLAETAYVLRSVYGVGREVIVDHLMAFLSKENVTPYGLDKGTVLQALLLCRPSGRVSIADAMVWAAARSTGESTVYSFDQQFTTAGLQVRQALP